MTATAVPVVRPADQMKPKQLLLARPLSFFNRCHEILPHFHEKTAFKPDPKTLWLRIVLVFPNFSEFVRSGEKIPANLQGETTKVLLDGFDCTAVGEHAPKDDPTNRLNRGVLVFTAACALDGHPAEGVL